MLDFRTTGNKRRYISANNRRTSRVEHIQHAMKVRRRLARPPVPPWNESAKRQVYYKHTDNHGKIACDYRKDAAFHGSSPEGARFV